MVRTYYRLLYRLDGSERWLLWYSNDSDGVVTIEDNFVPAFKTETDLLAYSDARGLIVQQEEPLLHDLDAIATWLADPRAETVACDAFLSAWNLFGDIARSCQRSGASFSDRDKHLRTVYEKLFYGNNLPSITPPGEHYRPEWSREEVTGLRQILRVGLDMFIAVRREQH